MHCKLNLLNSNYIWIWNNFCRFVVWIIWISSAFVSTTHNKNWRVKEKKVKNKRWNIRGKKCNAEKPQHLNMDAVLHVYLIFQCSVSYEFVCLFVRLCCYYYYCFYLCAFVEYEHEWVYCIACTESNYIL